MNLDSDAEGNEPFTVSNTELDKADFACRVQCVIPALDLRASGLDFV
jgi:hypothetical protein